MKKIFISFGFVVLLFPAFASAQAVDSSCLVPWQDSPLKPPGVVWFNPDSVKVDVCSGPKYLAMFAKNEFTVEFQYFILPHYDSLPIQWQAIDTSFSAIRMKFDSIEQQFGPFDLQVAQYAPDTINNNDPGDTTLEGDKILFVNFEKYLNIDTVKYYLSQLPELNPRFGGGDFWGRPGFYESINSSVYDSNIRIWPQPCSSKLQIQFQGISDKILIYDPLGRQLTIPFVLDYGIATLDFTNVTNGVFYISIPGHFFKILIQH